MQADPLKFFNRRWNCAESVVLAFQEVTGDESLSPSLVTAMGGGGGRSGSLCGALSGALLVLGALYKRSSPEEKDLYNLIQMKAAWLLDEFKKEFDDINCGVLTGYSPIRTKEELATFASDQERHEKCSRFVVRSAELLHQTLETDQKI